MAGNRRFAILVVDDYREMLLLLRKVLQYLGYTNLEEASDGAAALRKLREKPFDAVICDWNMKPVSGIQLLREIRRDATLSSLPFIMISGVTSQHNIEAARDEKVTYYIAKPFTTDTLRRSLEAALGGGSVRRRA